MSVEFFYYLINLLDFFFLFCQDQNVHKYSRVETTRWQTHEVADVLNDSSGPTIFPLYSLNSFFLRGYTGRVGTKQIFSKRV